MCTLENGQDSGEKARWHPDVGRTREKLQREELESDIQRKVEISG